MRKLLSVLMLLAALSLPWATRAQSTVTIGGGTSTCYYVPFYSLYGYSFTEMVYPADSINMVGTITKVSFYLGSSNTAAQTNNIRLYMKNVSRTTFSAASDYEPVTANDMVYEGTWTIPANYTGWVEIILTTPFQYDGASNLMVAMHEYTSGYSTRNFRYTSVTNSGVCFYSDSANPDPYNLGSYSGSSTLRSYLANMQLEITAGNISCYPVGNIAFANVTSESATLTWQDNNNTNASYSVYTVTATDTLVMQSGITDTSYTIYNLNPNTNYTFAIQADCGSGDESLMRYVSVRTACAAIDADSLPWSYGFEDATATGSSGNFNPCMGRYVSGSTTAYPYPSSTNKHTGTYGLYMYASTSAYSYVTLPLFDEDIDQLQLSFWAYRTATDAYGYWAVGVMTNPNDITTFDTIATGHVSAATTWEFVEVPLNAYTGTGTYLAILCPKGSATCYTYIDDITVDHMPTCFRPTAVTVDPTLLTPTSASLEITHSDATTFMVLWHRANRTTWDTLEVNGTTFNLTGLQGGFTYEGRVYTVCGSDTTLGFASFSFTTGCAAITQNDLPYTEDFEAYGTGAANPINGCWDKNLVGSGTTTNYPYPYSSAAINGSRGLYFYSGKSSSASYGCWAALPPIDENMEMSDLMVNFGVKRGTSVTNTTTYTYTCRLVVGVAETAGVGPTFVPVDTLDFSTGAASSVHSAEVSFADYTGTGKYVVFYAEVPANVTTYNYNTVYVDDVVLRQIPSCYWPSAVVLDTVSTDEATLSWTPDPRTPNPSSWTVEYGVHGFTPGNGMVETTNNTSIILSNLDVNTEYDVYVSANCGGDVSEPTSFRFQTNSIPATLPYYTGFEAEQDSGWVFLNADQTNRWMIGNHGDATVSGSRALFISDNGTSPNYNITAASIVYAFRLLEVPDTGDYVVSFDWRAQGESTLDYLRAFVVPNDVTITPANLNGITATATPEGWLNVGNYNNAVKLNLNGTWTNNETICHVGAGQTGLYKLVFLWRNDLSVGTMPPATVDNVHVWKITCPAPTNVTADSVGAYQIDYSWTAHGTEAGGWEVKLNNGPWIPVSTNSYSATGLTPVTNYTFMVRAICGDEDTSMLSEPLTVRTTLDCGPNSINIVDTIGNGTSASSTYTFHSSSSYRTGFSSTIYTAAELNDMGLQTNNRINGIKLHSGTTGGTIRKAKVYLKETSLNAIGSTVANDTVDRSTMTLVYSGDLVVPTSSWVEIMFDSVFTYSGNSNLLVNLCHDTNATAGVTFYYTSTSPDYLSLYGYRSTTTAAQNSVYRAYYRPNIVFNVCTEIPPCIRPTDVEVLNVVDTAMTLTWNGNAANYEVAVSTTSIDPDSATGFTTYTVADDTITINGLTQNTTYYYYVRALCSATDTSEWSIEGSVHTACSAQSLPYSENFESYASGATNPISPCWTKGTSSATAYPYPYATNAVSGARSLYFYGYHPSSTSTTAIYSYAALPMMAADSVKQLMMSFNVKTYSTASTYYYTYLLVGVMDNPNDISTFTAVDTINLHGAAALSVHGVEVSFANYTGTGKYIAIYDPVTPLIGGVTYAYSHCYVDDILVDYIPSCPRPTNVTVGNIGQNTATVHWSSAAANFEIEYGPHGFVQGNGVTVTSVEDSVNLTGLMQGTTYDVYVRALCSATDQSPWSFAQSFTTECGMNALPLVMDFEGYATGTASALPNCWLKWNNSTGSYNYYPYINTGNAHSGTNNIYFYFTSTTGYPTQAMLITPEIDTVNFPMNTVEVVFWAKRNSSYANNVYVGVVTNPASPNTSFVPVDTIALTAAHVEYTVSFANYTGTGNRIAFKGQASSTNYIYLDDIVIEQISACPRAFDLTAEDATQNSVVLGWTDTIGSTQWEVAYALDTSNNWNTVMANSNPFVLTGLTPNTIYKYKVAPVCAGGQTADWSRTTKRFSTAMVPAAVPYTYNFEDAAEWQNWGTASNNTVKWYRGNVAQGNTTNALYLSADNGATHSWNMNVITNAVAYRDIDFGATPHSYQLDFDAYIGGTIAHNYDGVSVVVADPAMLVESSNTGLTSPWGNVNNVGLGTTRHDTLWGHHTVYIDGVSGVKRVAFYFFNQATGTSDAYEDNPPAIDNVSITMQTCERPGALTTVSTTTNSAQLTWTGPATDQYQVAYRVQGAAASTNQYMVVTGTSATITGLTSSTNYYWWVSHICTLTATDTVVSGWAGARSFATACGVVSAADTLFENFESYTPAAYNASGVLPTCWEGYNASNTFTPHVTDSGSYSYCNSGRQAITMTSGTSTTYTGGTDNYLRLIDISEPTNTLTVAFWMCTESSTNGFLEVGYLTGTNYATDFVSLKHIAASSATMHSGNGHQATGHGIFDTVSFANAPAGNHPICFRWNYTTSYYSVCLDDIAIWSSIQSCHAPEILSDTASETTATITWSGNQNNYEVAYVEGATWVAPAAGTSVTGHGYTFTGLQPGTQYTLGVRTECASGLYSDWVYVSVTTAEHPCYAPSGLTVTNTTFDGGSIGWIVGEQGQNAFEVSVLNTTNSNLDTIAVNDATTLTLTGLYSDITYALMVRAVCGTDNYSDWSDTVHLTPLSCSMPTNVQAPNVTANSAFITWAGTASKYEVRYGVDISTSTGAVIVVENTTTATLTNLDEETQYDVYVRAMCADGVTSDWTEKFQFTTAAGSGEGINDVFGSDVVLYPNPASTQVTIAGLETGATVTLVDLNGRKSGEWKVESTEMTIDLTGYAQGAYFVRIVGEQGAAVRKLIVK